MRWPHRSGVYCKINRRLIVRWQGSRGDCSIVLGRVLNSKLPLLGSPRPNVCHRPYINASPSASALSSRSDVVFSPYARADFTEAHTISPAAFADPPASCYLFMSRRVALRSGVPASTTAAATAAAAAIKGPQNGSGTHELRAQRACAPAWLASPCRGSRTL